MSAFGRLASLAGLAAENDAETKRSSLRYTEVAGGETAGWKFES
jgi:hypothetical protein